MIDMLNRKVDDNLTYLVMINKERKTFKPGEQVYFNYGDHPNRKLLLDYGFVYPDNNYDTFNFQMRLDSSIEDLSLPGMIDYTCEAKSCQPIYLKRHQINQALLAYLRSIYKQVYYQKDDEFRPKHNAMQNLFLMKDVPVAIPSDLYYEKFVVDKYLNLMIAIDNHLLQKTTLEQDE